MAVARRGGRKPADRSSSGPSPPQSTVVSTILTFSADMEVTPLGSAVVLALVAAC